MRTVEKLMEVYQTTIAFQPIVSIEKQGMIFAYEALIRGPKGEKALDVLAMVPQVDAIAFDFMCRSQAIKMACELGIQCNLSLNISAEAICDQRYGLQATIQLSRNLGWPEGQLIFELTEHRPVHDFDLLEQIIAKARIKNVQIAIDDFGAAYAGLITLLHIRPEIVKLDSIFVRGINADSRRQVLVKGMLEICTSFGSFIIAEGVETIEEYTTLAHLGIKLMQGFLFARPCIAKLPFIFWPAPTLIDNIDIVS